MANQVFLADRLREGQTVITGWSVIAAPMITEVMARSGYPAVTVDMQHGMYDFASATEAMALIALAGGHRIVRIPVGDNALASRMADMGAECIIAPMINSAEEARGFADAVKYPPDGQRSWSPFRAVLLNRQSSETYLKKANAQTLAFAMIETQAAIDALDEILAVPALDGVFVGPSDLSLALTNGARLEPNSENTAKACATIASKARAAGKFAGIFCIGAEKVRETAAQGYQLMSHGMDTLFLDHSARTALSDVSDIVQRSTGEGLRY